MVIFFFLEKSLQKLKNNLQTVLIRKYFQSKDGTGQKDMNIITMLMYNKSKYFFKYTNYDNCDKQIKSD